MVVIALVVRDYLEGKQSLRAVELGYRNHTTTTPTSSAFLLLHPPALQS